MSLKTPHRHSTLPHAPGSQGGYSLARIASLSLVSVCLGAFVGLVAYALFRLIALITNLSFFGQWSFSEAVPSTARIGLGVILVPAVGGLIVGLLSHFGSRKIRGHGIDAVIESILFNESRVDPEIAVLKPVSSAVVIGTGGPFGVEGPIIQTGGAVGSIVGQALHLTASERKTLLAAGAASGLAATFGTPLAAVVIAIELLLFEYRPRSLIPVVLATGAATAVRYLILGREPIVAIGPGSLVFGGNLGWFAVLGIACGVAAVGFVNALEAIEALFERFDRVGVNDFWWPAIGGLALGFVGYFFPRALGSGYSTISDLLNDRLSLSVVVAVLVLKPLVTLVALGSRTSGGTLAPMFMSGAALGSLFGIALGALVPSSHVSVGGCALVAMAAFFAAAARAPFAFILFALEMTHSFEAVLPLMVAVVVAFGVSLALLRHSVMTLSLSRKGLPVSSEYEADIFRQVTVGQVMDPEAPLVSAATSVSDLSARIDTGEPPLLRHPAYILVDEHVRLAGIVTRGDLVRAFERDPSGALSVLEAGSSSPLVAFPDELVDEALSRMLKRGCGRLPVVSRQDPSRIVGYLGRAAVLSARLQRLRDEHHRQPGWFSNFRSRKAPQSAADLTDRKKVFE